MINIDGFDELHRNLDQLQKNIEGLASRHEVSFSELFPPSFMTRYSHFTSFDEMLAKSGLKVESTEDFVNIPDSEWDGFIASTTRFANWEEMKVKAFEEYAQKRVVI